jgi:hypothetical protein
MAENKIDVLLLQEFRLHAADVAGDAARIVAEFSVGEEAAVPLLTSIDDHRDVAIVRALHLGEPTDGDPRPRATLEPLVASWQPVRRYTPRITERSQRPPSYYRLAVTESGINDPDGGPSSPFPPATASAATAVRLALLWVGVPIGTYSGLMTVVGTHPDRGAVRADPRDWPLPLSRYLGVRIYESHD